ncbi:unnamed protein product [Bursaphelenchus okinawaensis]|uniref:Carboxylic ester hydrolase n=1 Tax=Bursaphelenchus okinawaensis TaxID=465554 RepID=A0A811LRK5_9BILA|nr:unnamed protein product [Bursaphelenchus okinawaensis]CAG9127418.1 unnamed protein product [Bursaphelenchus okinawaensis]
MICFIFILVGIVEGNRVRVSTGVLEGKVERVGPHKINVFKNVPFAEPPLKDLRFQSPLPKKRWRGIWDATEYSPACMSNSSRTTSPQSNVDEDCLYLNIWADERCMNRACPVLFYIHGGGFYYDSAIMFNETEIINKFAVNEIIFVIPAYRLGIFGFLDLGMELPLTPYNVGLYDILLSLRWIQKEISNFGGDKRRITLVGNSAGASTIAYLMSSPVVEPGAFAQAVIDSSVPLLRPHQTQQMCDTISGYVRCKSKSIEEEVQCLKEISAEELLLASRDTEDDFGEVGPQTDRFLIPKENFFQMASTYWQPKPLLIITTTDEMSSDADDDIEGLCQAYCHAFNYHTREAYDKCVEKYSVDVYHTKKDFIHAMHTQISLFNTRAGGTSYRGVFALDGSTHHANDLTFLIGLHPKEKMNSDQTLMNSLYPEIFRRFIRGEKPANGWIPTDLDGKNYFYLTFNNITKATPTPVIGKIYNQKAVDFWLSYLRLINKQNLPQEESSIENLNQFYDSKAQLSHVDKISIFWTTLALVIIIATGVLICTSLRLFLRYHYFADYRIAMGGEGRKLLIRNVRNS